MKQRSTFKIGCAVILGISFGAWETGWTQAETKEIDLTLAAHEKDECGKHLRMIHEAVQAYRLDHKELPPWLSDLLPKYIADAGILICPVAKRTGREHPYAHLTDPKIVTSYGYEFCDAETGSLWDGGKIRMRDWKSMQMAWLGGSVPLVRCLLHSPTLNVGFDGRLYESPLTWESLFDEVVTRRDLNPVLLSVRFHQMARGQPSHRTGWLNFESAVEHQDLTTVIGVTVGPDGKQVYTAAYNGAAVAVFNRDSQTGRLQHVQTISGQQNLDGAARVEITPDGRYAVTPAFRSRTVVLFARDPASGKLTIADIAREGIDGVTGLDWAIDGKISPDSQFIYVIAGRSKSVTVFRINESGKLKFIERVVGPDSCFDDARGIALSPDGASLYVTSPKASSLVVLDRDAKTGQLKIRQILKDEVGNIHGLEGVFCVTCSADGRYVYTSSGRFKGDDAISVFQRRPDNTLELVEEIFNGTTELIGFQGGNKLMISPDGLNLYALGSRSHSLAGFQRNPATGKITLTQIRLHEDAGEVPLLGGAAGLGISPDGRHVYVGAEFNGAVSIFARGSIENSASKTK